MERRAEQRRKEPATFAYVRKAADQIFENDPVRRLAVDDMITGETSIKDVGADLVVELGVEETRKLAARVGTLSTSDLADNPNNKVAKAAQKWAGQAARRITANGWKDPEPQWSGWQQFPRWRW